MNNRNGLDASYFAGKLALVVAGIDSYTPQELARELARLAKTADVEAAAGELAPSQPSAEALVQAALEAAWSACAETPMVAGRKWHPGSALAAQIEILAAIRALSAHQIIESCKEKS